MVSTGQAEWQPAFLFANPPSGYWGTITNPLQKMKFPLTVWYRQKLPPGVIAVKKPVIKGKYSLYVNGSRLNTESSGGVIDLREHLKKSGNTIALRVVATDNSCGLIQPLELVCGKSEQPLVSWNDMGLEWYSGRALYTKKVEVPASYLQQGTQLVLNLGQTNYFAEIWVNDQLVTFCPWAPFEADITSTVKAGENKISLVVANLLANQATWNILDDNITDKAARWWHYGSIQREKEKIISGLLGPVRIVPLSKESVEIEIK